MKFDDPTVRKLYKKLLALYPQAFKMQLGESMEQTFNDLYIEWKGQKTQGLFRFVFWIFAETAISILHENVLYLKEINSMKTILAKQYSAALLGLLFILPFVLLNFIVVFRLEPFFSIIRPGIHTSPGEYVLLVIVLLLLPAGAFIAARPIIQKGTNGKRKFYLVNGVIAVLLLIVFALLVIELGSEIYRCDVLLIPNCD